MELSYERLSALGTIHRAEPLSLSELAGHERVSQGTISRIVDSLEGLGLIRRFRSRTDGRGVIVRTTAKGRYVFARAAERSFAQILKAIERLRLPELEALQALFATARERNTG